MREIEEIIEALTHHEDSEESIKVLDRIGTNCSDDEVRELTARALAQRNEHESLKVLIVNKGKGINDLSPKVAMSVVNEILSLEQKEEAIKILSDTIEMHSDEDVRETARSVRALIELS